MEYRGDGRNRRLNPGKVVEILEMGLGGGNYISHPKVHKQFLMKIRART